MITVKQAAERACVTQPGVRYWLSTGKLTGHTDGRRVMIDEDELDELIADRLVVPEVQTFPYVHVSHYEDMERNYHDYQNMAWGLHACMEDLGKMYGFEVPELDWEDYKPGDLFN